MFVAFLNVYNFALWDLGPRLSRGAQHAARRLVGRRAALPLVGAAPVLGAAAPHSELQDTHVWVRGDTKALDPAVAAQQVNKLGCT